MSLPAPPDIDVLVVGAGMAGLTAARRLAADGLAVIVVDKGRAVGGRMATRRIDDARFDHGAQHFSARSPEFRDAVDEWLTTGVVRVWYHGQSRTRPERSVEPRFIGYPGMRALPEYLARRLDVRTGVTVRRLSRHPGGVTASTDVATFRARSAIVTVPLPQLGPMVDLDADHELSRLIDDADYQPTLAVMAVLAEPSGLVDGHAAPDEGPVAWMADNAHKGLSGVPSVTIHSTAEFAVRHLDEPVTRWLPSLVEAAQGHLGGDVIDAHGHRWRYAQPRHPVDSGCHVLDGAAPVVVAGEVFSGARVEGAYLSGLAAARTARMLLAR